VKRTALRLAAGSVAVVLPLAAVAACGTEKKKTVAQEFATAQEHLGDAKAASFTLRLEDAQGNLAKLAAKDGDVPKPVLDALIGGSITYVADAAGDAALRSVSSGTTDPNDVAGALKKANLAFVIKDDKGELVELRIVDGVLFAHVNLAEVGRLAEAGGAEDFDASLDEALAGMDPRFAQALKDVRAGKWLKLDVAPLVDDLKGLAESVVPGGVPTASAAPYDTSALGRKAWEAVKPHVTATDANDDSADRVIDVRVKARPALKALLGVLKAEKDLPFASVLGSVAPADIDEQVADGEARGQIRLADSHLKQVSLDLESLRLLSKEPGTDSLAGVKVLVDVDDEADELSAPTDVSAIDFAELLQELIGGFFGPAFESSASSTAGIGLAG